MNGNKRVVMQPTEGVSYIAWEAEVEEGNLFCQKSARSLRGRWKHDRSKVKTTLIARDRGSGGRTDQLCKPLTVSMASWSMVRLRLRNLLVIDRLLRVFFAFPFQRLAVRTFSRSRRDLSNMTGAVQFLSATAQHGGSFVQASPMQ